MHAILLLVILTNCNQTASVVSPVFSAQVPQNDFFKDELKYLETKKKLSTLNRKMIEDELVTAESLFGVPQPLLWCILFQESRFDPLKNATNKVPAKGLGQFTKGALEEINSDTNHYDPRTGTLLYTILKPKNIPISFQVKLEKHGRSPASTSQPVTSYFHTQTAVHVTAAYLNNRYQQLKKALELQKIKFNPDVLWLYAAASYNKGARSVFLLLTHEYTTHGVSHVEKLLSNPRSAYDFLTHSDRIDYPLRKIWKNSTRIKYREELVKNMSLISSCSLSELNL